MRHAVFAAALISLTAAAFSPAPPARAWVARSNQHAKVLLEVTARLAPERAGEIGIEGLDDAITDLSQGFEDRAITNRGAMERLERLLQNETDPQVRQDLDILLKQLAP